MKTPGILEGITFAIGASLAGAILATLLPVVLSQYVSTQVLIAALGLGYLLYLLKRSKERVGRVVMVALWSIATLTCLILDASVPALLLVQAGLIWIVRSLYFHSSVIPALLDLGLVATGLVASTWAILQTGSVTTAIWCFFLTQSLFVLIPGFVGTRDNSSCFNPADTDRFQSAHRVALDAVRKLSTH